jgi:excisionase family DNA binding protein
MNNPFEIIEKRLSDIETLLLELKQKPSNERPDERTWLDLDELCQYHPDKPAKATVYGWVYTRTIPVHKSGKKLRFLKSEIDNWLLQGKKKTFADTIANSSLYLTNNTKRG